MKKDFSIYLLLYLFVSIFKPILRSRHESRDEIEGFMVHD